MDMTQGTGFDSAGNAVADVEPDATASGQPTSSRRIVVSTSLGWGLDGYDYNMFPLALSAMLVSLNLSIGQSGVVTSVALGASAIGGITGGVLADRYNRMNLLAIVMVGFSVFTVLTATSQNLGQLILWRGLEGFFFGSEWAVGASLLAETTRPDRRGKRMGMLHSSFYVGYAVAILAYDLLFNLLPADIAWRALFVVGVLPGVVAIVIRRTTPEPARIVRPSERIHAGLITDLFKPPLLKVTLPLAILQSAGAIFYYSLMGYLPLYFSDVRHLTVSGTSTFVWCTVLGSFCGVFLSGYIADKVGRRWAFQIYYGGILIMAPIALAVPFHTTAAFLPIYVLLGALFVGPGGLYGSFFAELYPARLRATGMGFAYNFGRGIGGLGPLVVGFFVSSMGLGTAMLIVTMVGVAIANVMVWLLPETKGRDLAADHATT
jgi:MFS family permease